MRTARRRRRLAQQPWARAAAPSGRESRGRARGVSRRPERPAQSGPRGWPFEPFKTYPSSGQILAGPPKPATASTRYRCTA
eukprot:scaffold32696_cov101-Isochrysis_galbana.AAC.3